MSPQQIHDPETKRLAEIARESVRHYAPGATNPWEGSPFHWIPPLPPATKGRLAEDLVTRWCEQNGFQVSRAGNRQADRIIEGHRIEIKLSTQWASGIYKFQQIRSQDYDYCLCLGISPFDVYAWLLPKSVLTERVIGHMGQHGGKAARDTDWIQFRVGSPFDWMTPYGERLSDVARLLKENGKGAHSIRR